MLSEMAIHEPAAFAAYVERAKSSLPAEQEQAQAA
jgi:ribosomal protein L20